MMKKLIAAAAFVALGSAGALAADMAPRYTKAPAAEPVASYNWSGFYIGGNVGGAWSDNSRSYAMPFTTPGNIFADCSSPTGVAPLVISGANNPFDISSSCGRQSNVIGGGQIGYNWQTGTWLFGVEGDGAWQKLIERSYIRFGNNPAAGLPLGSVATDTSYFKSEQGALGTFRGRIGYTPGSWLLYATGGLAVGNVKHSVVEVLAPGTTCVTQGAGCQFGTSDSTRVGWTVGAGAEWMFARNWSIGAEYLYVDLGRTTINLVPQGFANFQNPSSTTFEDREHVVRLKLNYHFNGPVVAKY
jgi:outer membrane immunogenic protein